MKNENFLTYMFRVVFRMALRWYLLCTSRRYTEKSALYLSVPPCRTEVSLRGKRELGELQKEGE